MSDPLDRIRIASPCPVAWSEMIGDDRVRHCGHCAKDVYNVVAMTRAEAHTILEAREGKERHCLRLFRRHDGTVVTKDCADAAKVGQRQTIRIGLRLAGMLGLLGSVGALHAGIATNAGLPEQVKNLPVFVEVENLPPAEVAAPVENPPPVVVTKKARPRPKPVPVVPERYWDTAGIAMPE